MQAEIAATQRQNRTVSNNKKGRREKADRRQKIVKLTTQLDRRNIEDRRNTKDRRLSKNKTFFWPVTQQGITIKALNFEREKLTKLIDLMIENGHSQSYLTVSNLLKDVYFSLHSQNSKEKVLYQWYEETIKHSNCKIDYANLITQLNCIFEQEMEDIIAVLDNYLFLRVGLDENRKSFLQDMQNIQTTLSVYNAQKTKYIYPHYQEVLSLS